MNRAAGLPNGLANLGDTIRVIDRDGTNLGCMIVAEAQKFASEQGGELFVIEPTATPPVVHIVLVRKRGWSETCPTFAPPTRWFGPASIRTVSGKRLLIRKRSQPGDGCHGLVGSFLVNLFQPRL